ncbi:hypothetical protein JCGZ_15285 [Jatropha curcas]|uniref:Uncharacterized protein n=1 Tax=Jatropha curcas TaxID=180498 RepID=A0A067LBI8_JATCU|nr:hypothetical protein JCGZ_15285 [Jatropha curcas]
MARGRAFDSDESGCGSRGGRGRGRSTHGQGETIPPPSSGASEASITRPEGYRRGEGPLDWSAIARGATVSSEIESRLAHDSHALPESKTKKEREKLVVDEGEDWSRSVMTRSPETSGGRKKRGGPRVGTKKEKKRKRKERKKNLGLLDHSDSIQTGLI